MRSFYVDTFALAKRETAPLETKIITRRDGGAMSRVHGSARGRPPSTDDGSQVEPWSLRALGRRGRQCCYNIRSLIYCAIMAMRAYHIQL